MKTCKDCKESLPASDFNFSGKYLCSYCRPCASIRRGASNEKLGREHINARKREWRAKTPGGSYPESKKEYARNNREATRRWVSESTAKFKAEHPDEYAAKISEKARRREEAKQQRVPSWSSPSACRAVYLERVRIQKTTGIRHAVDHDVPLRGKLVSGLHVPENLVVIPFETNAQKSNKFDPMTYEWWPECCPKPPHKETVSSP